MSLKVMEFGTEEFWDYVFSLPKEQRLKIMNQLPTDWYEKSPKVYVEIIDEDKSNG